MNLSYIIYLASQSELKSEGIKFIKGSNYLPKSFKELWNKKAIWLK